MSLLRSVAIELRFAARERTLLLWAVAVFMLSTIAVGFGLVEVERQHKTVQTLIKADNNDRSEVAKKLEDWGSAAYYNFHLTYDPPSDLAFAAMGLRDIHPWKHRIRMLALEGQIYERDVANPSVALIGRFDFAFLAAFVLPFVLIMLLYDLRVGERVAGRHDLLEVTVGRSLVFWGARAIARVLAVFVSLILPLVVAGIVAGVPPFKLLFVTAMVFVYLCFWATICFWASSWRKAGSVILMTLIFVWVLLSVILPALGRTAIDHLVPIPAGAEILMLQRETVNDAWDLPRSLTMDEFFDRHPDWVGYERVSGSFEWQWYYAFQQVGDQRVEGLSNAYRHGVMRRAQLSRWFSLLAPPALIENLLQALADTDLGSAMEYQESVRAYHATLRSFYYPKFFLHEPFDKSLLQNIPKYEPRH